MVLSPLIGLLCAVALLSAGPQTEPVYAVQVRQDVVYAQAQGYWTEAPEDLKGQIEFEVRKGMKSRPLQLMMDIYQPDGDQPDTARPLLLMMHGGAYLIGHKAEASHVAWCRYFASLGYVAVSIDYRLGYHLTKTGFVRAEQDAVADAGSALRYLLDREDLRIDAQQVYLAGTSAGAATALALAYGSAEGEYPCRIRAVANLWGYVHRLEMLENARIPILSFQSEHDPVVPYHHGYPMKQLRKLSGILYGTLAIHEKATELGIPSEHHPCPEKRHRLQQSHDGTLTERFYEIRDSMAAFFAAAGRSL